MRDTRAYKGPKYPTRACSPIPAFNSYEEEAEWWDTRDTGALEFEDVFTPVEVCSTRNYRKQPMFRVDEEMDSELERLAEERDMKKATLVRKVVKDWLREQHESRSAEKSAR
ncbi:MAG TPA: CopG family antitoxin [Ktedonobacterales bacterium]